MMHDALKVKRMRYLDCFKVNKKKHTHDIKFDELYPFLFKNYDKLKAEYEKYLQEEEERVANSRRNCKMVKTNTDKLHDLIISTQKDINIMKNSRNKSLSSTQIKTKTMKTEENHPNMLGNTRYLGLMSSVLVSDDTEQQHS